MPAPFRYWPLVRIVIPDPPPPVPATVEEDLPTADEVLGILDDSWVRPGRARSSAPSWLSAPARQEWDRLAPLLDQLDVEIDRQEMVFYCEAWTTLAIAAAHTSGDGRDPAARIARDCLAGMAEFLLRIITLIRKSKKP